MPTAVALGAGAVATATVAGAWLATRRHAPRDLALAAAAGVLLAVAAVHLLPDAWTAAREAGLPAWAVPVTVVASFAVARAFARFGCTCERARHTCERDRQQRSGTTTAAALAVHRGLEGVAIAATGSLAVVVAMTVHAFGEGLAVGSLLGAASRRRIIGWLAALCLSPLLGAVLTDTTDVPGAADALVVAVAIGVVAQAAATSLRASRLHVLPAAAVSPLRSGAVVALAAGFTIAAVYATR